MTFLTLMACANVATLSLLRAEHRDREVAVRAALGARRINLLRLFVSEAGLLSLAGAALGLLLARLALQAIVVFTPIRLQETAEVQLDVWVFAFACGLAALAALLVGGLTFLASVRLGHRSRPQDVRSNHREPRLATDAQLTRGRAGGARLDAARRLRTDGAELLAADARRSRFRFR